MSGQCYDDDDDGNKMGMFIFLTRKWHYEINYVYEIYKNFNYNQKNVFRIYFLQYLSIQIHNTFVKIIINIPVAFFYFILD